MGLNLRELANSLERALRGVAVGALATLNAHFYGTLQKSFVEVVLTSPVEAYREATKVMPESMVRTLFRTILRLLGASPLEVETAVDGVARGDASAFMEAVRRLSESWRRRGGGGEYMSGGIFWLAPYGTAGINYIRWACWQGRHRGPEFSDLAAC